MDAETDEGLIDFFLETPAYTSIENGKRLVVTGRKGAGKTAIYSILRERAHNGWKGFHAVGLDFRNYPWDLHDAACATSPPSGERYAALWEFLMLVETAKLLIRSKPTVSGRSAKRTLRRLKRFVKRNWGGYDKRVGQMFDKSAYTLAFQPQAFGFSLGSLTRQRVPRERLAASLADVNDRLRDALEELLDRDASYFVLFDDLDSGFAAADEAARARLVGLLEAARELAIWAQQKGLPLTPVVFLRSDIHVVLRFADKNKIDTGRLERIAWSESEDSSASLKTLIEQRIGVSIGYQTHDPWAEVFADETIDGRSLYRFMASRTHRRPRDMIQLANECLEQANAANAPRIGADHVLAALPRYSEYLLREIADAAHQSVDDWDECLMIVRRLGAPVFERAEFDREHEARVAGHPAEIPLQALYRFGVIGYRQGHTLVFAYQNDAPLDLSATRLEVHPGLWAALELEASAGPRGGDTDQAS